PNNILYTLLLPNACTTSPPTTANSWGTATAIGVANDGLNGFEIEATASTYYLAFYRSTTSVMLSTCAASSCSWLATPASIDTTTVAREGLALNISNTNDQVFVSYARLPGAVAGAIGNDIVLATGATTDVVSGGNLIFAQSIVDNLPDLFPATAVPSMSTATAPNGMIGYTYFYQDATVADAKLYYGVRAGPKTDPVFPSQFVTSHQESAAAAFVGTYPSLVYNLKSQPIIAYYNGQNKSLDVAVSQMNSGFSIVTVDDHASDDLGQFPSAAVKGSTIGVSYHDATATGLKFARFSPNTGWKRFAVDGMLGTGSCGNAASNAGKFSSLKFTSDGRPVIAYQFDGKLRVAYAPEAPTSATYTWNCLTIDSNGNIRGEGIALALSSTNQIHIAHFDASLGSVRYSSSTGDIASALATGSGAFNSENIDNTGITSSIVSTPGIALTSTGVVYVSYFSDSYHGLALANRDSAGTWTKEYVDVVPAPYPTAQGQNTALTLSSSELPIVFYRSNENWIKYFGREYD
ncbi:MAG: esterase, partial [Bdellovibrionales bacterium]|nr:esterase [Bdellovibrionales bacterium]